MTKIRILHTPAPLVDDSDQRPQLRPLTHHEILSLMAPFTQRGRHADLAASQRVERRLVFKSIEHAPTPELPLRLLESLSLEVSESGTLKLVRCMRDDSGLISTLTAEGTDAGRLLERIEAVPAQRQFQIYADIPVARSYLIEEVKESAQNDGLASVQVLLTEARAYIGGINLEIKSDGYVTHVLDLRLTADAGSQLVLPQDLTAVIGWHWRPLHEFVTLWRGSIRVVSKGPQRATDIEHKIGRTIIHLARTLETPPAQFHRTYKRARWRVTFQRALPLGIGLLVIALTPAIQWIEMSDGSILRMLIFHAPPLMMAALFMMREIPRIEIPPIPRPLTNDAWVIAVAQQGETTKPTSMTADT